MGPEPLTQADVVAVARHGARVLLTDQALAAIAAARRTIDALADDEHPHYGISTGFGALATRHIPPADRERLQRSLIRSHAAGSGRGRARGGPRADAAAPAHPGDRAAPASGRTPPRRSPRC